MLQSIAEPTPFFAILWTTLILLAWTGWGFLACRLSQHHDYPDWGLMAAWGMASCVALGGMLNLLTLVSPGICVALVLFGVAAWPLHAISTLNNWIKWKEWSRVAPTPARLIYLSAIILLFCLGLLRLVQHVIVLPMFNGHDDFHAYLMFPLKMLQTGWLTPDPFNASQMGSLGGQSLLQTLVLAVLPLTYVKLFDPGLCVLVCSALIFGYQKQHQAGPWSTIAGAGLPLVFYSIIPVTNASAGASAVALYLALYRTFDWIRMAKSVYFVSDGIMMGLVAAASVALKSTVVPYVAFLLTASCTILASQSSDKRIPVGGALVAAATAALVLLPWMIVMYLSVGTFFYPFLGEGYRGTTYGTFPKWSDFTQPGDLLVDPWLIVTVVLAAINVSAFRLTSGERAAAIGLSAATTGGTLAILWATAGNARYTIPYTMSAVLILTADIARRGERLLAQKPVAATPLPARRAAWALVFIAVAAIYAVLTLPQGRAAIQKGRDTIQKGRAAIQTVLRGGLWARMMTPDYSRIRVFDERANVVAVAQKSVPEREALIAKIFEPFLLDHARNRIYVVDWAHGSSPPPGMPFDRGGDALAEYLLSKSIRYVLYEYDKVRVGQFMGGDGWYAGGDWRCRNRESAAPVLSRSSGETGENAFECAMDLSMADFIRNLDELMRTREVIFENGHLAVLDLSKRR